MKSLALLALAFSIPAFAAEDPARTAVKAISSATIAADLASAMKDSSTPLDPKAPGAADADYVVCMGKGDCARIVVFEGSAPNVLDPVSIVLEYDASADNSGKVTSFKDSDIRFGRLDLIGALDVVKRLLPSLEKDSQGFPAKNKRAYHPFNIQVINVAGSGSWGGDQPSVGSSNYIVSFTESTDGHVDGENISYTYLVRTKSVDDKIVKFEQQRLKMNKLLK